MDVFDSVCDLDATINLIALFCKNPTLCETLRVRIIIFVTQIMTVLLGIALKIKIDRGEVERKM